MVVVLAVVGTSTVSVIFCCSLVGDSDERDCRLLIEVPSEILLDWGCC